MLKVIARSIVICLVGLLATRALAQPGPHATVQAALNVSALQPGKSAALAVVLDVRPGFHAQSNKPLDKDAIPTTLSLKPNPALTAAAPLYPEGEIHEYPGLGKLSVYSGRVIAYVPIQVKPDATPGPTRIEGSINYQICDDQGTCFPDVTTPFTIDTKIIPASESVTPANAELFKDLDQRSRAASTQPAASPAAASPATPPVTVEPDARMVSFLGWHFRIDSLAIALVVAFVVGIIFNVMPCVLPVLPLKAISFYEVAQHSRSKSFLLSVAFSLGIIATFGGLAILVVVLKTIAWGQLFAQGWFIWAIVAILVIMAAGMFGAFSIQLPAGVYSITPRHDTYTGNFLFGILAAVLATPCTAPMFPPLLAFAASQTAIVGVLAMLTVGVGMAFPYLILSAFPELARRFPRTGPISELVKHMMGFLLLAAAAFFAGGRIIQGSGYWWLVFAVIVWAALYLVVRTTQLSGKATPLLFATAIAIAITGLSLRFVLWQTTENLKWEPYSDARLAEARRDNKITLVKFTAAWCGNCQYVEATVFHDPKVIEVLNKRGVIPLKADLTDAGAPGQNLLNSLSPGGGIPLTAIYVPGQDQPIKLASIYSSDTLLKTLQQIGRQP